MNKYEGMFIVRPDLPETEAKTVFGSITEAITKNNGNVSQAAVWSEKRKLCFPIAKQHEAVYYLVNFTLSADAVAKIRLAYKLNENILRVLITRQ